MNFYTSKELRWDIQECIPHYYQVSTRCDPPTPDPFDCNKSDCTTTTLITVMACDVEDVCKQIKKNYKNVVIDKIIKFTKPALRRDQRGRKIDPTCNVDVTPTPETCINCCELLGLEESESSSEASSPSLSPPIAGISLKPRRLIHVKENVKLKTPEVLFGLSQTDNFVYYGSGVINFTNGEAGIETTNAGELLQNITFTSELLDELVVDVFVPEPTIPLPQTVQTIRTPCCKDAQLTLCLELKHTLNKIKPLTDFLRVNNLVLPGIIKIGASEGDFIKLNYSSRQDQWRGNLHYVGQSAQGSFTESWDIGFTFTCFNQFWQFAITASVKQPSKQISSRMILYYLRSDVCPDNDSFFGFRFNVDTTLLESKPLTSQPIVLNDDAGLFRNLQMGFRILAQNRGTGSSQLPVDNTVPYNNSFLTTGGI